MVSINSINDEKKLLSKDSERQEIQHNAKYEKQKLNLVYKFIFFQAFMAMIMGLLSIILICKLRQVEKKPIWPPPPPYQNYAEVARYIMHISEWGSLATISTHKPIEGYPFNNIFSVSDGTVQSGSGVPYFYLSELELSVFDIHIDNRATLTMSEAQSKFCDQMGYDPESPLCSHLMLTGRMVKIENGTEEYEYAKNALFTRHPIMPSWPKNHNWFFAKLDIVHIYLLDFFGGAQVISPQEYLNVSSALVYPLNYCY